MVGASVIVSPAVDPGLARAVEGLGVESLVVLFAMLLGFVWVRRS